MTRLSRIAEHFAVAVLAFGLVGVGAASALTIDFEGLVNGQGQPLQFVLPGVIVDVYANAPPPGNHLGVAIFDSDPLGPNAPPTTIDPDPDLDLLIDSGNILILQNNSWPTQTVANIFDTPNDDEQGGEFFFDFSAPSFLDSVKLIDINGGGNLTVTLTDIFNETRTFTVPDDWTGDIALGAIGFQTLDLTTLANQIGVGPGNPIATANETALFNANQVVQMRVLFSGSAALDDLVFSLPEPSVSMLIGLGLAGIAITRRRNR